MSGTLRLRGSTSGYSELTAPAVAGDQTFILPAAGGTLLTTDSPAPTLTLESGTVSAPSLTFEGDSDTGIYSPAANKVDITAAGASQLVVTSSGIGIGTENPTTSIHVDTGSGIGIFGDLITSRGFDCSVNISGTFTGNYLGFFSGLTGTTNSGVTQINGFTASSTLGSNKGSDDPLVVGFNANIGENVRHYNVWATGTAANYFRGRVLLGEGARDFYNGDSDNAFQTNRNDGLRSTASSSNPQNCQNEFGVLWRGDTSSSYVQVFSGPTSASDETPVVRGGIRVSNTATIYATSSDYRLKENVIPISNAIERVKGLKPCRFNFISTPNLIVDGFLAHEAQEVVPEAVTGLKDEVNEEGEPEYQGIDKAKLVPLLTAGLKEAISKIETLETKVATLEAGNS